MKQKTIWVIVAVVVVAIIIVLIYRSKNNNGQQANPAPASQTSPSATPAANENTAGTTPASMSYADALKKYGSNRIQFDSACQAHPNNVTFKAGTLVMFDNRAPVTRKINFNGIIYSIPADNYIVVSMTAAKYPATILVDCGSSQNVATVLIQK
jgi:hypothetical protein